MGRNIFVFVVVALARRNVAYRLFFYGFAMSSMILMLKFLVENHLTGNYVAVGEPNPAVRVVEIVILFSALIIGWYLMLEDLCGVERLKRRVEEAVDLLDAITDRCDEVLSLIHI